MYKVQKMFKKYKLLKNSTTI